MNRVEPKQLDALLHSGLSPAAVKVLHRYVLFLTACVDPIVWFHPFGLFSLKLSLLLLSYHQLRVLVVAGS